MKGVFNFPEGFDVVAQSRGGWKLVDPYLPQIKGAKLVIFLLGVNNVVARGNALDKDFRLQLSETMVFLDMMRNFCNFNNTEMVLFEVISRGTFSNPDSVIGRLKNRMLDKFKPHFVDIEERIKWAVDGIHLTDEIYYKIAAQVAKIKAGPKPMKEFVN